jgi:hypothetical protein
MDNNMDTIVLTDNVELKKPSNVLQTRKKILCFCGVFVLAIIVVCAVCLGVFLRRDKNDEINEHIRWCGTSDLYEHETNCRAFLTTNCNITLIESIPENLTYPDGAPSHPSIYSGWLQLLDAAQSTIYIASSYWSLRSEDIPVKDPSSWQGDEIFNKLEEAGKRGDI